MAVKKKTVIVSKPAKAKCSKCGWSGDMPKSGKCPKCVAKLK